MEKIVKQNMLYDFYGMLLTDHQRAIYEAAVFEDLSLSELADIFSITRQGVHDLIKRSDKILSTYEDKLHLLEKSMKTRIRMEEVLTVIEGASWDSNQKKKIQKICEQIIEEL